MKATYYIASAALLFSVIIAATGCRKGQGFLDPQSTAELNERTTFIDSARTVEFLNTVYQGLSHMAGPQEVNTVGAPLGETTDEADSRWPGGHNVPLQVIGGNYTGNWANRVVNDWATLYNRIRQANIYLKNVDGSPLSAQLKARTKLEARFLRAYYYHILMKFWGGVPIVGDTVYAITSENAQARATYEDCVNYVVSELDAIAPALPTTYSGLDYGRITKGAALALKARVLLYAASPLFNGGSFATDPELIRQTAYPTADPTRWQKALQAAQDVVNLNQYELEEDNTTRPGSGFYRLFLKRINSEYILAWMRPFNRDIESNYLTPSRGGAFLVFPTQELVDAFPMKDGLPYTASPLYDPARPYDNRDPRFGFTVIHNESLHFNVTTGNSAPVYTYVSAPQDGIVATSSNTATNTGYYRRKMADTLIAGNSSGTTERSQPLIRYAEVLLNLAEAANETGNTTLAMDQLKLIRRRAGIEPGADNNYGYPANPSKDEARQIIRNERFIELAFEEHRYFDLRRWRLGSEYDGKFTHGMRITKSGSTYTYQRINVRSRYFKVNSYLFPIPQNELSLNLNMRQNPGW
jgi:starch-binding outer membrane protein, SusD/RagB family